MIKENFLGSLFLYKYYYFNSFYGKIRLLYKNKERFMTYTTYYNSPVGKIFLASKNGKLTGLLHYQ